MTDELSHVNARGDEISQSGTVVVPFCVRMILSNLVDKRAEPSPVTWWT